ncbi:MAG: acyl carrier protein [Lachnospiraceae bacterium]|nr:acyl carrier protein [Lachnospiraceae bacterium]
MDTMERLKKLLAEVYDGEIETETITEETRVAEDIGMKSIAMLYMAMAVEGEFGVSLTNEDLPKMRTVGDIIRLIEERQA